jgi:hypothetical protein
MLERASPPLVRAPVRSRQRYRRWDLGPIQFVRDPSQDLLDHVPLYLGPGRRVVVLYVLVDDRCGGKAPTRAKPRGCRDAWLDGNALRVCTNQSISNLATMATRLVRAPGQPTGLLSLGGAARFANGKRRHTVLPLRPVDARSHDREVPVAVSTLPEFSQIDPISNIATMAVCFARLHPVARARRTTAPRPFPSGKWRWLRLSCSGPAAVGFAGAARRRARYRFLDGTGRLVPLLQLQEHLWCRSV